MHCVVLGAVPCILLCEVVSSVCSVGCVLRVLCVALCCVFVVSCGVSVMHLLCCALYNCCEQSGRFLYECLMKCVMVHACCSMWCVLCVEGAACSVCR